MKGITLQQQTMRRRMNTVAIATGLEDSSYVDLCTRGYPQEVVAVYVRPNGIEIPEIDDATDRESYRFDGMDVHELRDAVLEALHPLEPLESRTLPHRSYRYCYPLSDKEQVYASVRQLQ